MYHYLAMLFDAQDANAASSANHLAKTFERSHPRWVRAAAGLGAVVLYERPDGQSLSVTSLPLGCGVVLGTLFPKDLGEWSPGWTAPIDESKAQAILRTRGQWLVDNLWGRYVAILSSRDGSEHHVIRDCSGRIPCHLTQCNGVTLVWAQIEDVMSLPIGPFTLNKKFISGFIFSPELAQRECGLNEVTELSPGDCLALAGARSRQYSLWDPREIYRRGVIEDFDEARTMLRSVTQGCIDAWASCYQRIILHLSGGLDSSIVLGCLRNAPARPIVTCVNSCGDHCEDDERKYARLAARQAGAEILEIPMFPSDARLDERVFRLPVMAKPSVIAVFEMLYLDSHNAIAERLDAQGTWTGQGGDHIFFQSTRHFGAIDYFHTHGMFSSFGPALRDAVKLSRRSYWDVLGSALWLGSFKARWKPEDFKRRQNVFVNPEVFPTDIAEYVWQPWSSDSSDIPVGKRLQIAIIAELLSRHRAIPGQFAREHHPLMSQPLLELCIRIPTYTLLRGGRDRALARAAFHGCVPDEILRRRNKGTNAGSTMDKLRESSGFVRELLLDGILVREGILQRQALEPYLCAGRPVDAQSHWPLHSAIAAEVWARKWEQRAWRADEVLAPSPHAVGYS
ncbi:MAG: asparagine synthase-related protein [Steroidobacteraceae bacterium]